jgi:hypothetical protein
MKVLHPPKPLIKGFAGICSKPAFTIASADEGGYGGNRTLVRDIADLCLASRPRNACIDRMRMNVSIIPPLFYILWLSCLQPYYLLLKGIRYTYACLLIVCMLNGQCYR